jgi:hypothetical protein
MNNLYYIETRRNSVHEVLEVLQKNGLHIEAIRAHYIDYKRTMHDGELIMWTEGDKYPCWVHRSQEDVVRRCGIKVDY